VKTPRKSVTPIVAVALTEEFAALRAVMVTTPGAAGPVYITAAPDALDSDDSEPVVADQTTPLLPKSLATFALSATVCPIVIPPLSGLIVSEMSEMAGPAHPAHTNATAIHIAQEKNHGRHTHTQRTEPRRARAPPLAVRSGELEVIDPQPAPKPTSRQ
jgi:hypothetical protein